MGTVKVIKNYQNKANMSKSFLKVALLFLIAVTLLTCEATAFKLKNKKQYLRKLLTFEDDGVTFDERPDEPQDLDLDEFGTVMHPRGEPEETETEDRDLDLPRDEEEEETEDFSMPREEEEETEDFSMPRGDVEDLETKDFSMPRGD